MTERLRPADLGFLVAESASTPMHNATLEIFEPGPGRDPLDYDRLLALVADRIAFVPRYRQRIRSVPGRLANPVWVDDEDFDLTYHVRRSAVPRPGSIDQVRDLTARIVSRQLDRGRPLWEMYLIEGLEGGRSAILSKSHQILVDGIATIDLGQVILDVDPEPSATPHVDWRPQGAPGSTGLLVEALRDSVRDPRQALSAVVGGAGSVARTVGAASGRVLALSGSLSGSLTGGLSGGLSGRRAKPDSPLNTRLSEQRRFMTVRSSLEDYRRVRRFHGGTVNDVILATVTGAMRGWLMTRGEPVPTSRTLRAMVPMSVIDSDLEPTSLGSQVAGHLLNLPIGEASPVVRLHQVSYQTRAHREGGRGVTAPALSDLTGFAAPTLHSLGTRLAAGLTRRMFHLVVTNVPGPQKPLYLVGARMLSTFPVVPLTPGLVLAVGVTSYDGRVCFGLTGDRDALPDLDVVGQCLRDAVTELVEAVR
jgi:diacylglycerol O-acyltransferase